MQLKRIKVGAVLFAIHWFAGMIHTSVIKITCNQCVINSARTVDTGRHGKCANESIRKYKHY